MEELVRVSRVTSNDGALLVYLPKKLTAKVGIRKGTWVAICSTPNGVLLKPLKLKGIK